MPLVSPQIAPGKYPPTVKSASSTPLKFGFLAQAFAALEQQPLTDLVAKDMACYILPQAGITRTKNELLDFLPNALGLLAVTVSGMMLLPLLLRKPVSRLTGIAAETLKKELPKTGAAETVGVKEQLARLAVAFGFAFPFATGFISIPFFRNWLTLKRTGTMDFEQLIGLEKRKIHTLTPAEQKMESHKQLRSIGSIMGIGAGLSALSVLGFSALARKKTPLSQTAQVRLGKLFEQYALRGKTSNAIKGNIPILLFWLAPAYLGWMISARSRNEKIEQAVKALNSIFWFSLVTPLAVKPIFLRQLEKLNVPTGIEGKTGFTRYYKGDMPSYETIKTFDEPLRTAATKVWKRHSIAAWLIPVTMLALTPQLLNIHFTKKRYAKSLNTPLDPQQPHHRHGVSFGDASQNPFANRAMVPNVSS